MSDNIYLGNNSKIKIAYLAIAAFIDMVIGFTSMFVFPFTMIDYSSAALGFFFCLSVAFGILMVLRVRSLFLICAAKEFAKQFNNATGAFITISNLKTPLNRKWT